MEGAFLGHARATGVTTVRSRGTPETLCHGLLSWANSHPAVGRLGGLARDVSHAEAPSRDPAMLRAASIIMSAVACAAWGAVSGRTVVEGSAVGTVLEWARICWVT